MAPSALLPGLRHAAGIVATLRHKVDKHAPLSSHATLIYTIALGEIEEAIRSLETPDLTADEAPEAVLDGGLHEDEAERTGRTF